MSSRPGSTEATVQAVVAALEVGADPDRARTMAAYMRDKFPFLGVDSPTRRALLRPVVTATKTMSGDDALAVTARLWELEPREYQYAGTDLLRRHARSLDLAALDPVKRLITTKSWWDTVDTLAAHTVGPIVRNHDGGARMDQWITDANLWLARTAILHQLGWKSETDPTRLFAYCEQQAGHQDFFIRKAIGWALRDYARTDPEAVRAFVAANRGELAPLSVREACKHIGVPT